LLQGDSNWAGPGGQTAYIDATDGDLIVFHALSLSQNGLDYLFVRSLTWANDWPVIGSSTESVPAIEGRNSEGVEHPGVVEQLRVNRF
ncbi:MAG: hypothetical protein WA609_04385, partial [Terriglobales bacterium]